VNVSLQKIGVVFMMALEEKGFRLHNRTTIKFCLFSLGKYLIQVLRVYSVLNMLEKRAFWSGFSVRM
jgi:hypothetical protein